MKRLLVLLPFVPVAIGAKIAHLAAPAAHAVVRDVESNWLEGAFPSMIHGMLAVAFFYF